MMALYGEAMNARPRNLKAVCESCGKVSDPRWHRIGVAGIYPAEQHAQTRRLVSPGTADYYKRPDLAGKRICPNCYTGMQVGEAGTP